MPTAKDQKKEPGKHGAARPSHLAPRTALGLLLSRALSSAWAGAVVDTMKVGLEFLVPGNLASPA